MQGKNKTEQVSINGEPEQGRILGLWLPVRPQDRQQNRARGGLVSMPAMRKNPVAMLWRKGLAGYPPRWTGLGICPTPHIRPELWHSGPSPYPMRM